MINSEEFKNKYKTHPKHFTRNRKLPFSLVILFQLSLLKQSLQSELDNFFSRLLDSVVPYQVVSDAAFCKARQKCSYQAFDFLGKHLSTQFYNHCQPTLYKGFRLIAIDGTVLYLPQIAELEKEFGKQKTGKGGGQTCVMAQASFAYDVYSHVVIDAQIEAYKTSEQDLFYKHCLSLSKGDLVIADRGYTGFWLMPLLLSKSCSFCIRHQTIKTYKQVTQFLSTGNKEAIIELYPSTPKAVFRLNTLGLPLDPITVRVLRIELPTGETEVLITNLLDQELFPYGSFLELYALRWPVEESYKTFKSKLEIENFTGKTADVIRQDFYSKVFMLSLCGIIEWATQPMLEQSASQNKRIKHKQMINRASMQNTIKQSFGFLFIKATSIVNFLKEILISTSKNRQPIRPNRSYPRKSKPPKRYYMNVKPSF